MISLDLNHFGFLRGAGQRGGEGEEKKENEEVKRGYSRSRANLNGGELNCENTSGAHKGSPKRRGTLCQGQHKWWRAGRGNVSPRWGQ